MSPTLKYREPGTGIMQTIVSGVNDHGQLAGLADNDHPQYVLVSQNYGPRNKIINGDFSVNQRGFTSSTTSGTFGFDRWQIWGLTGFTFSSQAAVLGELPESAGTVARVSTVGQSAAGDHAVITHRVESARTLSGKTATVSFWAKSTSGAPKVGVEIRQSFGSGGSPSAQVIQQVGSVTVSTTWARYSLTVVVPSIAGKTLGTADDGSLQLLLWTSAGSTYSSSTNIGIQNTTIDFWGVQLEEGPYATPYEKKTYADELRACQRYYYRIRGTADASMSGWASVGSGVAQASNSVRISVPLAVALRANPVATCLNLTIYSGGAVLASSAVVSCYWSSNAPAHVFTDLTTSGATIGQAYVAYTDRTTVSHFTLDAEF